MRCSLLEAASAVCSDKSFTLLCFLAGLILGDADSVRIKCREPVVVSPHYYRVFMCHTVLGTWAYNLLPLRPLYVLSSQGELLGFYRGHLYAP